MSTEFDLVVRNGRLAARNGTVDIGVRDGRIVSLEGTVVGEGATEIDAEGGLVSPGLVDCHVHMDKAFAATGEHLPKYNDEPFEYERIVDVGREYFETTPRKVIEDNAVRHALCALANGTRHIRTHVTVHPSYGTKTVEAVATARERLRGVVDVEIVAYSEEGVLDNAVDALLLDSVDAGADLVGGMDPATLDGDLDAALETWFDVATTAGVGIDSHIHEAGSLGVHTIRQLAEKTVDHGLVGNVTVSHGFALSSAADKTLTATIAKMRDAGLNVVTCHQSLRSAMPMVALLDAGVPLGQGTDNIRDFVFAHGRADIVQGLLASALRLAGDPAGDSYRMWETNDRLARLWELPTTSGAEILGIDQYEVAEGTPADLVVYDAPSPQWAIMSTAQRMAVVSNGQVVAREGGIEPATLEVVEYDGPVL